MSRDFPLYLHASGNWAKKVRGKTHYFGKDKDEALQRWLRERDDLLAGRSPARGGEALADLLNRFLASREAAVKSGELSPRSWQHYHATCQIMVAMLGRRVEVKGLTVADFDRLRAAYATGRGVHALSGHVQRTRTIFKWAWESGFIETPMRFGPGFKRPPKQVMRAAKHKGEPWALEADAIRAILDAATPQMRAMVLLGINCGFGNSDVASLPLSALDLDGGWVSFPRPKTAVPRRAKLWPETVEAVRAALEVRPRPKVRADAGLVFLTRGGLRWVRVGRTVPPKPIDEVQQSFGRLLRKLGLKRRGRSFYSLRHTFRTVADASGDGPACDAVMGHVDASMGGHYRERIDDARIERVTDLVREWLWPKPKLYQGRKAE